MRLLDVGCGWGSLSLHAAEHFGARVTGVTIAAEQKRFIDARIRERGLEDLVEIRLQDYREIPEVGGRASRSTRWRRSRWASTSARRTTRRTPRSCTTRCGPAAGCWSSRCRGPGTQWHPGGGPFIESFIAPDMHMRPVGETVALPRARGARGARRTRAA